MKVLSDVDVERIIDSLELQDLVNLQKTLYQSLVEYQQDDSIIPPRIISKRNDATYIFMPLVGSQVGIKNLVGSKEGFNGVTLILDKVGNVTGIINARVLTAFRTALASSLPLTKIFPVESEEKPLKDGTLLVFGVGLQALWHVKLTCRLYPDQLKKVLIINRTLNRALEVRNKLQRMLPGIHFQAFESSNTNEISKACVNVKVVYGCTPSTLPIIVESYLTGNPVYISAIGSYQPHMVEVQSDIIKGIVQRGDRIIVDSVDHVCREAGEIIQNNLGEEQLISMADFVAHQGSNESPVYLSKIVGLSLMDIVVGSTILEHGSNQDVGQDINL